MKKIIIFIVMILAFISCDSSKDQHDIDAENHPNKKEGTIKFYSKSNNIDLALKEILSFDYFDYKHNKLGTFYTGFVDTKYLKSLNSITLYISNNFELDKIDFVYSKEGSGSGHLFWNSIDYYNDDAFLSKYDLMEINDTIKGRFEGRLFINQNVILEVDSCIFQICR